MPLIPPLEGQILVAIITILYGIFVEKWYVSKTSIQFNVFTWIVLLFTIDVPHWLLGGMAVWLVIGYALTRDRGRGGYKQLFGSKVFGSLALMLGLIEFWQLELSGTGLLIGWGIITVIVVFIGERVK